MTNDKRQVVAGLVELAGEVGKLKASWWAMVLLVVVGCGGSPPKPGGAPPGGQPSAAAQQEIVIGEYGSLSGDTAAFGKATHDGIMLAVEEVNKAGGVKGRKVRVVTEDDQSKTEQVTTCVKKLINTDRVLVVLGEVASSRSMAGASVCEEAKVPMVSPSSTNPAVTVDKRTGKVKRYIFRVCFLDPFQGTVMARFARNHLRAATVAVLKDIKQDYSVGLAQYFVEEFKRLGGTISTEQSYSSGDTDFRAQLTSIKETAPDAIFLPGYYNDVGNIALQARSLGIEEPFLGGDGWDHPEVVRLGRQAVNGCYYSSHFSSEDQNPTVRKFVEDYYARFKEKPSCLGALGYDAARLVLAAIERAADLAPDSIRDELEKTKDFPGVTGKITLDEQHNPVKPAVVIEIRDGQFKFVTSIAP